MNPLQAAVAASLALAIIVSSAWVQPEAQEGLVRLPPKTMWAAKRSNIRTGPGTQYAKVGLLEVGRKVVVTGQVGKWFRIREGGGHAFVYSPLLSSSPPGSQPRGDTRRVAAPRSQVPPSRQGKQVITYRNGRYEGQVRNGKRHGRGVFTWTSGNRYDGDWRNDKRTGRGVFTWSNGDRYDGDFVDGKKHGQGTYSWADGDRYQGEWRNGNRTGRGVFTWPDGERYEGDFVDGKITGRGIKAWPNGNRYEGQWLNDFMHGRGTLKWANGNRYEGDWRKGKRTGRGVFTWPDGERYEGDFVDGKRHGQGTYSYANGDRYKGEWRNGKRTGRGTLVSANGKVREGEWRDSKLVKPSARSQRERRRAQSPPARRRETRRQPQAQWGAIVVYEDRNGRMSFGATWNNPNPNTAHQRALDKCNEERGGYCDEDGFRYLAAVFSTAASREDILSAYGPEPIFSFATSPAPGRVVTLRRRCVAFYDEKGGPPMMAFGNSETEAKNRWSVFENDGSYTGAGTLRILCNDR